VFGLIFHFLLEAFLVLFFGRTFFQQHACKEFRNSRHNLLSGSERIGLSPL